MPQDSLLDGVDAPLHHLLDRHERFSWKDWVQLSINASKLWTPDEIAELGRQYAHSPFARPVMIVARLLFSSKDIAKVMSGPIQKSGNSMFRNVDSVFRVLSQNRVQFELTIQDGHDPSPEFFHVTRGFLSTVLTMLGGNASELVLESDGRVGRYIMTFPRRRGIVTLLWQSVSWPFTARAAARELESAHDALQVRYRELESAREILDRQAAQLRTAHAIGELINQDLDLERSARAVSGALRDHLGARAASVRIEAEVEGTRFETGALCGKRAGPPSVTRPLVSRGAPVGSIEMWLDPASEARAVATLDFVLPSVTMAFENALTHESVVRYRDELEERVERRTADLARASDELARSLAELKAAQEVRQRIFANINHEIRTPLSLISLAGSEAGAAARAGDPGVVQDRLEVIERGVGRLLGLVDGLLLLASRDEGKLELKRQTVDLAAALRGIVDSWAPLARAQSIDLGFDGPAQVLARVDPGALDRALGNLLSNAIKFTPDGGRVTVSLERQDDGIHVAVTDSGIGIGEDFAARAFERFEQGKAPVRASASRGSGIGLSIVRELVEAHGGAVSVAPGAGGGTRFTIVLPPGEAAADAAPVQPVEPRWTSDSARAASAAAPPAAASDRIDAAEGSGAPGAHRATILFAEDDPDLRGSVARILGERYRVLTAPDGVRALELAEEHRPDLLISDIEMPRMDGLELTRRFLQLEGNRLAPVLLLTASAAVERRLAGFGSGAVDYILKPFHPPELAARVRAQLAVRDLALRLHESEKLAALGLLGAGLAHNIRNPLNAVVNALVPLRRKLPPELLEEKSAVALLFDVIDDGARRLLRVTESILHLENPGRMPRVDLAARALVDDAIASVAAAEVTFEVSDPDGLEIHGAPELLIQVLTNLLQNACDASEPGQVIRVELEDADDAARILVRDQGAGIAADDRERIFEPFFTRKGPDKGTGLGLPLSRKIVAAHGGSLRAIDSPIGATFEIRLPRAAADDPAAATAVARARPGR